MILRNDTYENFAKYVKETKSKIIVYGAGMIGQILAPYILNEYKLDVDVCYYVDMDEKKQRKQIQLNSKAVSIRPVDCLIREKQRFVLLITNSNFVPVVNNLEKEESLKETIAYVLPIMQLQNENKQEEEKLKKSPKQLIPKKIHYCWFSKNPMPRYLEKCIDTWKRYCPDYEIIRWDENNYDISKYLYMKQAYEAKMWGFVPEIARLDILYHHGGIYLDSDVEVIRNLDDLLYQPAFCGVEKWGSVDIGGGAGAEPFHPVIKAMLDYRKDIPFLHEDGSMNLDTCGCYETVPLIQRGMKINDVTQCIEGMTVYSSEHFHPFDYMSGELTITPKTYSIHHFNGGWLNEEAIAQRKKTKQYYNKFLAEMDSNK